MFERLTLCEINVVGRSSPKKEMPARISFVELHLFGKNFVSQQPAIMSRMDNILFNAKLPDDLVNDAVADATTKPDWASHKATTHKWLGTTLQRVELLETELHTRTQSDQLLVDRIATLEKAVLGKEADTGAIDQRIELLENALGTNSSQWKPPQSDGAFAVVSGFGKKIKQVGKNTLRTTSEPAKNVLKSPTFWMLLLGAGALTGLYFATRNSGGGSSGGFYPDPVYGCHGDNPCHVCTDCSRCVHCNSGRSSCVPARNR